MCSPSFIWLREIRSPPVELLPAALVFRDPRNGGKPVFFSDVIVRRQSAVRRFADLKGRGWAYNDACSLSGYFSLLEKLAASGEDASYFSELRHSGSHLGSIQLVASGEIDAAAIDSNVLARELKARPVLRGQIRVIDTWGPFPIQPLVVRAGLPASLRKELAAVLLDMAGDAEARRALAAYGVEGFAPIGEDAFDGERRALRTCETLLAPRNTAQDQTAVGSEI